MQQVAPRNRLSRILVFLSAGVFLLFLAIPSSAFASSYDCSDARHCGLPGDGAFQALVIGTVVDIARPAKSDAIFHWARGHGYWAKLPDDAAAFTKAIQVLSVEILIGQEVKEITLLMGRKDFNGAELRVGDYVRHAPHPPALATMPGYALEQDAYWEIYGCIAALCRVNDITCPSRYRSGLYSLDGVPIDMDTGVESKIGTPIDPITYFPAE